ncbi:hypothetical protein JVU11DRAFT_8701 [Chiua virens]|nr:hypothetical protein JVU11DRAFT_8701 [Chiua virens]
MQPQRRVPTIDDLKVKLCYICREEERYDAPGTPPRTWTHPCTCTLIAHEACLLRWIQSSQTTRSRASNALQCPQCGTAYELTSSNPLLLRWLDMGNKGLSMIGRIVSVGSLTVGRRQPRHRIVYTKYCVRSVCWLFGTVPISESLLIFPLIPLALIFSRLPLRSNVTPLIPLLLAWPTSAPVGGDALNRIRAASNAGSPLPTTQSGKDLFPLLPHWPPPPFILGLFIFPIVREGYRRLFSQFAKWMLGMGSGEHGQGQRAGDMQRVLMGAVAEDEPFLRIRVNAHIDEEDEPAPPGAMPAARDNRGPRQANGANDDNVDDGGGDAAAAAENTIRVSGTSLGRLIGGALIIPRISSLMGSLLLWLSKRSVLLCKFLAVRPPLRAAGRVGPLGLTTGTGAALGTGLGGMLGRSVFGRWSLGEMGLLKKLGVAGMLGLSVAWRGTHAWAECDPVAELVGIGLVYDRQGLSSSLHLYLTKRELESRRVKNRSFEGVDIGELDLIEPQAHV